MIYRFSILKDSMNYDRKFSECNCRFLQHVIIISILLVILHNEFISMKSLPKEANCDFLSLLVIICLKKSRYYNQEDF